MPEDEVTENDAEQAGDKHEPGGQPAMTPNALPNCKKADRNCDSNEREVKPNASKETEPDERQQSKGGASYEAVDSAHRASGSSDLVEIDSRSHAHAFNIPQGSIFPRQLAPSL